VQDSQLYLLRKLIYSQFSVKIPTFPFPQQQGIIITIKVKGPYMYIWLLIWKAEQQQFTIQSGISNPIQSNIGLIKKS